MSSNVSFGQTPNNGGFEATLNTTTDWTTAGATSTTNARTGVNSLAHTTSSTSNIAHTNATTISIPNNNYAHVIGWAIGSNANARASCGGTLNGTAASATITTIGTTLTQLTYSIQNTSGSTQSFSSRVNTRSVSGSTIVYWDDVIMYTSALSSPDLTKPVAPTAFTNGTITSSSAGFSWTNGSDAATGIQNTIILRTTNLSAATPAMNDQGVYTTSGGTAGPNIVSTDWTVLSTSVGSGTTTYTDATVSSSTTYKYAVIHRDLAYNYSTALVSGNIAIPSGAITSTTTGGAWTTGSTWIGGIAPTSADNVIINGPVTTGAVTRNSGTTTTINLGASLAVSGTFTCTGATTAVNGTFQLENGGWATGANFIYGSSGTLVFNNTSGSGAYGVNNTDVFWPSSSGPVNVTVANTGGLNLGASNTTSRTVTGIFQTVSGVSLNNSSVLTLNGTCQINNGGFFSNSPIYGSASTLVYNIGSAYSRGNEWTTATSGAGYPNNVQISNPGSSTTLNMGSTVAQCAGSITIDTSATLNTTSNVLTILGSVTSNGTISLGGDVKVSGNWTIGSSGTQTNNSKAVFFNGASGNQTITKTGAGTVFFDYLIINKAAGNVVLNTSPGTDVTINTTSGDVLQLSGSGQLDLNGREIKLQNTNGTIKASGAQTITSSVANAKLSINGNKFITGGTLSIGANVDTYLAAAIDFGSNVTTINGLLQINSGGSVINNAPIYGSTALLKYFSSGIFGRTLEWSANAATATFPSAGFPNNVQISNTTTLDLGANSGSGIARSTNGYLTIDDGSKLDLAGSSAMTKSLTVNGDFTIGSSGTATVALSTNSGADLYLGGDIYFNGTYAFFPNNRALFFTKNGTEKINAASTPTIPYIVFQPASGSTIVQLNGTDVNITAPAGGNAISFSSSNDIFDLNGRTLTLGTTSTSNTISGSGTFKGSTSSNLALLGNGSIGTLNFTSGSQNLGTLTMNRQASVIGATLGTALTITTNLALSNGIVDIGANNLTLGASATVTGTPSASTFIIAENGELRKTFTANGSFLFPVGDNTAGLDYSPATLNFTSGSYSSAYVGVKITDAKHPNNGATTNFITRYWSVSSSGITSPVYNFSGTYTSGDINGTETLCDSGQWNGTNWTVGPTVASNTLSMTGLTSLPITNQFTAGNPLAPAEINITGNSVSIPSGDVTPLTTDFTDFGSVVIGGTIARTFTIQNIGATTLNLTSSPIVALSGSGASAFSVTTQPSGATIAPGANRTFIITYTASAVTSQNATVTIANDDSDENPYTFAITGIGTPSVASDIIANAGYTYNSNIAYATYQSATISNTGSSTGGSIDLFKLDIRDGGATADTDALPTILSGITFNVTNTSMIRSAALFSGNTLVNASPSINTGAGTIAFSGLSGLNVTAADGTSTSLTLRVTFLSTVTDNTQFQVTISNSNVVAAGSSTSSLFTTFTSVVSSTTSDRNRIEVTADRLAFVQDATNGSIGVNMSPSPTVSANDALGNRDLDYTSGTVSITSSGTLSSSPQTATFSSGLATFTTINHSAAGTGLQLTATYTGLTNGLSVSFDIASTISGTYRTTSNGTWPSGTASWERFVSGSWTSATPSASTTDLLIIRHTITSAGAFAASGGVGTKMQIENGATFTGAHNCTLQSMQINSGGTLIVTNPAVTVLSGTGTITVESGGKVTINSATLNNEDGFWQGIENFKAGSTLEIQDWDWDNSSSGERLIDSVNTVSTNSDGYYFGNIIFNGTPVTRAFTFIGLTGTHKLCKNNLTIINGSTSLNAILTAVNANVEIGGDLIVTSNKFSFGAVSASTLTHTVKGNLTGNGGTFDLNQNSSGSATVFVNLEGNLNIPSGSSLNSTDDGCKITFTNTSTTQTASIAGTLGARVDFEIASGSTTQLINQNLSLTNSTNNLNVLAGGILEFNGFDITGAGIFDLTGNGTLRITSIDGVNASGTTGNVKSTGTRTFSQTGIYQYVGNATPQSTGNAMTSGSTTKRIIIDKTNTTDIVNLTQSTGTSNELYIKKGVFVETSSATINGSGNLTMDTDGTYKIGLLSTSVPQLSGTFTLSGNSTIELNGNGSQILKGIKDYRNLIFSNTTAPSTSVTKTLSSAPNSITGTVKISEAVILDVSNNSFGGSGTNLTMTETSKYVTAGSATQPTATGTYTLGATTTIEFNGSSATDIRLSPTYGKIIVSGTNVSNSSATTGIKFQSGGTFTVNSGATFKLANTAGFAGSTTAAIDNTNSPTITLVAGSTIDYNGASQSITATPPYSKLKISGTGTKTIPGSTEVLVGDDLNVTAGTLQIDSNKLLTVTNGITNTSGNDIIIKNSGNLVQITDGIADSGTIKMTRTSRSMLVNDYVYWGSPIQEDLLSPLQLPLNIYNAIYMWNLNPAGASTGTWNVPSATVPGRGFITRVSAAGTGSTDFDFKGTPNNGVVSYNVTPYDASSTVSGNTALLANPYPSAIDAATFIAANPKVGNTGLGGTLYFWTASTPFTGGAYLATDYATWNGTGSTATSPGASSMSPTGKIAAGQGFFAQVFADTPTTTNFNVTFNNSMRVRTTSDNSQFFRTANNEANRIWLNLTKPQSATFRQLLVGYITDATNELDRLFDGNSFTNNEIDFYSLVNDKTLVIQGRALPFQDSDLVPLGYKATNSGIYTISIDHVDGLFENGQNIYLEDKLLDVIHDIKASPYNFNTTTGTFNERFVLRYNDTPLGVIDAEISNSVIVAKDKQQLIIKSQFESISKVSVYDILGRKVFEKEAINATLFNSSDIVNNQQTLIVKVTLTNGQIVTRKIIY